MGVVKKMGTNREITWGSKITASGMTYAIPAGDVDRFLNGEINKQNQLGRSLFVLIILFVLCYVLV